MSQTVNHRIQGIIQHPIKVRTPNIAMRDGRIETFTLFHFPKHSSNKLVRGSFIPEFFASWFDRPVKPWRALVIVQSGDALLGMYIQHSPPIRSHTPHPFSARIMPRTIQFSHAILLERPNYSILPFIKS
jgi:hypothetical protein